MTTASSLREAPPSGHGKDRRSRALRKRGMDGDVDFLREALKVLVERIINAEASTQKGAGYGERSPDRVTHRNGYRPRAWDTRVGTMKLYIPNEEERKAQRPV